MNETTFTKPNNNMSPTVKIKANNGNNYNNVTISNAYQERQLKNEDVILVDENNHMICK